MRLRKTSFTLLEILIVITLLGSFTFGAVMGITRQFAKMKDVQRKMHLKMLHKALNEYYDETSCFPHELPLCDEPFTVGNVKLINNTPCDPETRSGYAYVTEGDECNTFFRLYTTLDNHDDRDITYVGCENGCGTLCDYNYGLSSVNRGLEQCEPVIPTQPAQPSITPTTAVTPTPTPLLLPSVTPTPGVSGELGEYVCAPGYGNDGHCTLFEFPDMSDCPRIYVDDPVCNNECMVKENHCKNSKGKNKKD